MAETNAVAATQGAPVDVVTPAKAFSVGDIVITKAVKNQSDWNNFKGKVEKVKTRACTVTMLEVPKIHESRDFMKEMLKAEVPEPVSGEYQPSKGHEKLVPVAGTKPPKEQEKLVPVAGTKPPVHSGIPVDLEALLRGADGKDL